MNRKREQAYRGKITSPLDNLFGDSDSADQTASNWVTLDSLCLPAQQPRRYFDPQKMEQLVQSIKAHGILEPLLVRPLPDRKYELVAGERRYRAATTVGLTEVPVTVRELSNDEALQLSLVENLQREDLNPVEETEGILQLLSLKLQKAVPEVTALLYRMMNESKGNVNRNVTVSQEDNAVSEVFTSLGLMKWESFVRNRLPLLNLPQDILEALRQGHTAYTKAQAIAQVKDKEKRKLLLEEAIESDLSLTEIRERINALKPVPDTQSPKNLLQSISTRLTKSKTVWNDPKKLKKLTTLLQQMEALLEE
ncbi:MAG: ParB/RepB/Spo0J family partition protein [Gloeocapsa sp. UFS-A4-WI-NPMV-4B04]|jgi:ParB family chromosome partitioning protein|nr:ParB/RepB/Spo0J family partition protein [Gloeocapsa sp. UFS-A4-WI-NPMV-4B04]